MNLFAIIAVAVILVVVVILLITALTSSKDKTSAENTKPSSDTMSDKEKEAYKKEKQEREWSDPNEHAKYVCHGGQAQCKYCNVPISDIIVTSTTILLQNKPWATVQDKDGLVNFNFTGQCMHPSQQKPLSPPPPCKAVIQLGEWKGFSDTIIDKYNALLVKSAIPCMISGEDLEIIDSGQKAKLAQIEPKMKLKPRIIETYWINEDGDKIEEIEPNKRASLVIKTEDYRKKDELKISLPINGKTQEYTARVDNKGTAIVKNIYMYKADHLINEPRIIESYWQNEKGEKIADIFVNKKATMFVRTEGFKKGSKVTVYLNKKDNSKFHSGSEKIKLFGAVNSEGIAIIKNTVWS